MPRCKNELRKPPLVDLQYDTVETCTSCGHESKRTAKCDTVEMTAVYCNTCGGKWHRVSELHVFTGYGDDSKWGEYGMRALLCPNGHALVWFDKVGRDPNELGVNE